MYLRRSFSQELTTVLKCTSKQAATIVLLISHPLRRLIPVRRAPNSHTRINEDWDKPRKDWIKVNCDACLQVSNFRGSGAVIRNGEDAVLA